MRPWLAQDMDLVPLLIQENYVNHKPAACGNDLQHMKVCALHERQLRPRWSSCSLACDMLHASDMRM